METLSILSVHLQGHYVFLETSGFSRGQEAWLVSELLDATQGDCLTFWYHLYGQGNLQAIFGWKSKVESSIVFGQLKTLIPVLKLSFVKLRKKN